MLLLLLLLLLMLGCAATQTGHLIRASGRPAFLILAIFCKQQLLHPEGICCVRAEVAAAVRKLALWIRQLPFRIIPRRLSSVWLLSWTLLPNIIVSCSANHPSLQLLLPSHSHSHWRLQPTKIAPPNALSAIGLTISTLSCTDPTAKPAFASRQSSTEAQ